MLLGEKPPEVKKGAPGDKPGDNEILYYSIIIDRYYK
jgi:hypothetical protein